MFQGLFSKIVDGIAPYNINNPLVNILENGICHFRKRKTEVNIPGHGMYSHSCPSKLSPIHDMKSPSQKRVLIVKPPSPHDTEHVDQGSQSVHCVLTSEVKKKLNSISEKCSVLLKPKGGGA